MTHQEKAEVKKLWVILSAYYRQELLDEVILMYTEDVADLPFKMVYEAMHNYRRNPKNRRMPLPSEIREMVEPAHIDDDLIAAEAVARIITAVSKFGNPNSGEAEAYIGSLGWAVVEKQGGWLNICANMQAAEVGIFQAQAKTVAKAQLVLSRLGKNRGPSLPQPIQEKIIELGKDIKRLEG